MKLRSATLSLFLLAASLYCPLSHAQETPYYRYKDDQGVTVISSTIPPKYVRKGYEIITIDGRLIKTIPPELSDSEKAKLIKQQEIEQELKEWDEDLLRRYSSTLDIEDAKQRRLSQNILSIGLLERSAEKVESDIVFYQGVAAADEREGRSVNHETLEKIQTLKQDKADILEEIKNLKQRNQGIEEKFDRDIERFKIIRPNSR